MTEFRMSLLVGLATLATLFTIGCGQEKAGVTDPGSELSETGGTAGAIALSTPTDQWREAIYREICYALSQQCYNQGQWGASTRVVNGCYAGDWDYMGRGVGNGGECKGFAAEIVRRATGGRYTLPSGYNYATGDIAWCRPGDVIQRSDSYGTPHTAVVFAVLARDASGRATLIDVIDSNFVAGHLIARHKLSSGSYLLSQFRVW